MKNLIFVIGFFIISTKSFCQQNVDSIYHKIISLDLNSFSGKPVDSLLQVLPSGYSTIQVGTNHRFKKADRFIVIYQNIVRVEMMITNFTHINPILMPGVPLDSAWDVQLCKKELISCVKVFNKYDWFGCGL